MDKNQVNPKVKTAQQKWTAAIPIICVIVYFLLAFSLDKFTTLGKMGYAWSLFVFLLVPFAPFITGLKKFRFAFPAFISFFYVVFCLTVQLATGKALWHPMWVLFLLIPLYYIFFGDKEVSKKLDDEKAKKYANDISDDSDFDADKDAK